MESKHVVESAEDRLRAWRDVERASQAAEAELAQARKGTDDNLLFSLAFRAKSLRQEADRMFSAILRSIRMEDSSLDHMHMRADQGRDDLSS